MKRRERESRFKSGKNWGGILGIELFEDTQILRIAVIGAHFSAVGPPQFKPADNWVDFPLADLDQPDAPNATVMIVLLRLHPGEPITGAFQFRYHHRDSVSPDDGLDLKRTAHFIHVDQEKNPDTTIAEMAALLSTVGEPMILDVSDLDVTEALEAFAREPVAFVHPRIN